MRKPLMALAGVIALSGWPARAQDPQAEIERYRQMLADGNPAELVEAIGEELWKQKRGPNNVTLEQCDFGLGPGVLKGAYARMPRYFADTDQVMDFESRLVHCMVTLQGFGRADLVGKPYSGAGQRPTDLESLVAYAVEESRGAKIAVPQSHPKEREAYQRGQRMFYYRGGPYDFSCSTCHAVEGQRIRLQELPKLDEPKGAKKAFATWPAYRVSQGAVRTMQWRLNDCFRQQRFPDLQYTSQASIDLITFLGVTANGGTMDAPAIKR